MSVREVTNLRKAGRLDEALNLALNDIRAEKNEYSISALFWVYRDLAIKEINNGNLSESNKYFEMANSLYVNEMYEMDEYAQKAIEILRRKLTPYWDEIASLTEQSKNGQEELAYNRICELNNGNGISNILHEDCGWIIFRYLKRHYVDCGSVQARRALLNYLRLQNNRPSLLHSQMLNLAMAVSEKYQDFKFLPFLELWGVNNFTVDDHYSSYYEGNRIEPLIERIIRRCFNLGYSLKDVINAFGDNSEIVLSIYSKYTFFELSKFNNGDNIAAFFSSANTYFDAIKGIEIKSEFHSKILSLFLWKLPEEKTAEILSAVDKWGMHNFKDDDWIREKDKSDETKEYPSLVEKVIKRYFLALKTIGLKNASDDFISLLKQSVNKFKDEQTERNLAFIYVAKNQEEKALTIYRQLLLKLNRFYVWKELSDVVDNENLKISALCKAVLSEPKEEFLGEIHLILARLLIDKGLEPEAKCELNTYYNTYQKNGWKIKNEYNDILNQLHDSVVAKDNNKPFYLANIQDVEDFVYAEIEWETAFVSDIYIQNTETKSTKKAKLVLADGRSFSIKQSKLDVKSNDIIGMCFDIKIHSDETGKDSIVLIKKSAHKIEDILNPVVCYVDYYNPNKNIYSVISETGKESVLSVTNKQLKEGDFCLCFEIPEETKQTDLDFFSYMIDDSSKKEPEKTRPQKVLYYGSIERADAIVRFHAKTAIVDNVNDVKKLFHCVFGKYSDIIIKYDQTSIRPKVGEYVSIRYILKTSKDGSKFKKMLTIEKTYNPEKKLSKTINGCIRLNTNSKGQLFGFVDDYYVPEYLIKGIEDDDFVTIEVIFDGDKWRAYSLQKN